MEKSWAFTCLPRFFELLKPGNPELAAKLAGDAATVSVSDVSISIKETIVGIIPANFVKPFLDSNMMQLIFLAVLIGIALEKIGEHSRLLKDIRAAKLQLEKKNEYSSME